MPLKTYSEGLCVGADGVRVRTIAFVWVLNIVKLSSPVWADRVAEVADKPAGVAQGISGKGLVQYSNLIDPIGSLLPKENRKACCVTAPGLTSRTLILREDSGRPDARCVIGRTYVELIMTTISKLVPKSLPKARCMLCFTANLPLAN